MSDFFQVNDSLDDFKHLLDNDELEEEPVDLHTFVTNKYYLGLKPLSPVQTNIVNNMTQIYFEPTLIKIHGEEEGSMIWKNTVNEVVCEIGKGGGKDFCLAGDTPILTDEGLKPIATLSGKTVTLLTSRGWKEAPVYHYGKQRLYKIVARRGKEEPKEFFATKNHRWFATKTLNRAQKKFEEFTTTQLKPGYSLQYNFGQGIKHRNIKISEDGVRWGFSFGDGTLGKTYFYGEKDSDMLEWFPQRDVKISMGKWNELNHKATVYLTPYYYKTLPPIVENPSFLYGWLAGYFAADGTVSKEGVCKIYSKNLKNIEFVRDVAARLGIGYSKITKTKSLGFNKTPTAMYSIRFLPQTLTEEFFLITEHRKRFIENWTDMTIRGEKRKSSDFCYKVLSVEETDRYEDTYCPSVPETGDFTLDGHLLTGNSIRIGFLRIIYLLHCLRDPLEYFGIGQGEYIDLLNVALNAEQAQRVFFDPLKNILKASPYFNSMGFLPMSKKVEFEQKPIRCFSGHSESESWEGFNLIAVVLDEISAFKIQDDKSNLADANKFSAKAIYDMSRMSVVSRFPEVGKVALLSFPRYEGDYIEQRYAAVIGKKRTIKRHRDLGPVTIEWYEDDIQEYAEPKVWAIKCPTFVSNPTKKPEHFVSDFIRDPVNAKARILCLPPKASDAYFRDPEAVLRCFHDHSDKCFLQNCPRPPWDEEGRMPHWFRDPGGPARFVHVDLSQNRDRSAISMVHCMGFNTNPYDGQKMPVIRMDLIKYWEAPPDGEVDFSEIRRFIFALNDRFNIAMVTIDRWNSIDTKNILLNKGIYTDFMVVDKRHYDTLSTSIYDQRLQAYYDHILVDQELLKLQLINAKKVDHPSSSYKDGSDCLAGAVYTCTENTVVEEEIEVDILGFEPRKPRGHSPMKRQEEYNRKEQEEEEQAAAMPTELKSFLEGMNLI